MLINFLAIIGGLFILYSAVVFLKFRDWPTFSLWQYYKHGINYQQAYLRAYHHTITTEVTVECANYPEGLSYWFVTESRPSNHELYGLVLKENTLQTIGKEKMVRRTMRPDLSPPITFVTFGTVLG